MIKWLLNFIPGIGPVLSGGAGFFSYIFKPSRLIVWVPLLFLTVSIIGAGIAVRDYVKSAEASKREVVSLQGDVKTLGGQVQLERESVETVTRNIQTYTKAVQVYAAKQVVYQQQIGALRNKLAPAPIIQKAQTDAKGASSDVTVDYDGMLRMFDDTTKVPLPALEVREIPAKPPLPQPSPIVTQPVQWQVVKKGPPAPDDLFTLSAGEFKKLTDNETEFLRWIKEAVAQFAYYTEPSKSNATDPSAKP